MSIDHAFGNTLIPSTTLRRVRQVGDSIRLDVDTEEHDLALLRSIAEAVRTDDEVVEHLKQYAEIYNRLDELDRQDPRPQERQCLLDEAADLRVEIDRAMEWQALGEGQMVPVNREDTATLAAALVRVVADQIQNDEPGVVRDLRLVKNGGAA